jgi:hypothetical protein
VGGELDLLDTFSGTGPLGAARPERHVSAPPPDLD